MQGLKILVADNDPLVGVGLQMQLTALGHRVVGVTSRGDETIELIQQRQPELVILEIKLPGISGLEVSRRIMAASPRPIILLTVHVEDELIRTAAAIGVMAYLVKPVDFQDLASAITLAWRRFQELQLLTQEAGSLHEALAAHTVIDQAKCILMKRRGLSEEEAFQYIRRQARDCWLSMQEIALTVVQAEEMMGYKPCCVSCQG
jgi:AmiR/NasT family two-component response regulator